MGDQELLDFHKRHMILMAQFEIYTPKHHLMFHLCIRAREHGNPWLYHTFLDESLNKQLKAVCRNVHQMTFESTVLSKMVETLRRLDRKRVRG
jgi:hypothetical protein